MDFWIESRIALEAKLSPVVQSPGKNSAVFQDSEAVEAPCSNSHRRLDVQSLWFHSVMLVTLQNETSDLSLFSSTPRVDVTIRSQCDDVIVAAGDGGEMLILNAWEFHWSEGFRCSFRRGLSRSA